MTLLVCVTCLTATCGRMLQNVRETSGIFTLLEFGHFVIMMLLLLLLMMMMMMIQWRIQGSQSGHPPQSGLDIHYGQLILRKISKIGVTRCRFLRLKCTKFDFRWGSAPDPTGGAYSAPPDPLAVFKGPTYKGREGKGKERGGKWKGKGKGGEGCPSPNWGVWIRQCADTVTDVAADGE